MRRSATMQAPQPMPVEQGPSLGRKAGAWLCRKAWRYRAQLAPAGTGAAMLIGTSTAHALDPQAWWVTLPAGALLSVGAGGIPEHWAERLPDWALDLHWLQGGTERSWAAAIGGAATLWAAADWGLGPSEPLTAALAVGVVAVTAARTWHRRLRHSAWSKRLRRTWRDHLAASAKLPGSRIQSVGWLEDGSGYYVRLRLAPGQHVSDVRRNLERVTSALDVDRGTLSVEGNGRRARRVTLIVQTAETAPVWLHNGQEVARVDQRAISVEPLDDEDVESGILDSGWRPRIVEAPRSRPVILDLPAPKRLPEARPAVAQSDQLLDALRAAPEGGLSRDEIIAQTGIAVSTLTRRLAKLREDGKAETIDRGRWRGADGARRETGS